MSFNIFNLFSFWRPPAIRYSPYLSCISYNHLYFYKFPVIISPQQSSPVNSITFGMMICIVSSLSLLAYRCTGTESVNTNQNQFDFH